MEVHHTVLVRMVVADHRVVAHKAVVAAHRVAARTVVVVVHKDSDSWVAVHKVVAVVDSGRYTLLNNCLLYMFPSRSQAFYSSAFRLTSIALPEVVGKRGKKL